MGKQERLSLSGDHRVNLRLRPGLIPRHRGILSEQGQVSVEGDPVRQRHGPFLACCHHPASWIAQEGLGVDLDRRGLTVGSGAIGSKSVTLPEVGGESSSLSAPKGDRDRDFPRRSLSALPHPRTRARANGASVASIAAT